MRIVIQRVKSASVVINRETVGKIDQGYLVLLGIEHEDDEADVKWLCQKLVSMRIFPDDDGKMNRDILEAQGDILLVSQFTLYASTKKGNRPSFIRSARPELAIPLYNQFKEELQRLIGKSISTGEFGAMMEVSLINDGPVTITMDSRMRE